VATNLKVYGNSEPLVSLTLSLFQVRGAQRTRLKGAGYGSNPC
jgi:hypothetical protein